MKPLQGLMCHHQVEHLAFPCLLGLWPRLQPLLLDFLMAQQEQQQQWQQEEVSFRPSLNPKNVISDLTSSGPA